MERKIEATEYTWERKRKCNEEGGVKCVFEQKRR